jgi:hypothetical protein
MTAVNPIKSYQLALTTPGISPRSAISLKQSLHSPKSRMNARALPQRLQRVYALAANLGFFLLFSTNALRATVQTFLFRADCHRTLRRFIY